MEGSILKEEMGMNSAEAREAAVESEVSSASNREREDEQRRSEKERAKRKATIKEGERGVH